MRIAFAARGAALASALVVIAPSARAAGEERAPLVAAVTQAPAGDETPAGYFRDVHGKLMQTEFDMDRRVWLGGGWAPRWVEGGGGNAGLAEVDFGARINAIADDGSWRGRFHILEGEVGIGRPWSMQGTLFSYDESRRVEDPILRVSTFWPRPVRHDVYLSLGFWGELLDLDARPDGSNLAILRPAGAGVTWDLWHNKNLRNTLRVRLGAAAEDRFDAAGRNAWFATGIGHLELDAIVDRAGFHHFTADAGADAPLATNAPYPLRFNASGRLGYEVIVLAVNDQPITLRLSGRGGYRDDLEGVKPGWSAEGDAGLRMNLWAPPPRADPEAAVTRAPRR